MGHALVGHFLEHTNRVHKITIVSRGQALRLTISLPTEDGYMQDDAGAPRGDRNDARLAAQRRGGPSSTRFDDGRGGNEPLRRFTFGLRKQNGAALRV
jgi:hypothetical protein